MHERHRILLTLSAPLLLAGVLAAAGCDAECREFSDCPEGYFCTANLECREMVGGAPPVCAAGGFNDAFWPYGSLAGVAHYTCAVPPPSDEDLPRIVAVEGTRTLVSGGSAELMLSWTGAESLDGLYLLVAPQYSRQTYAVPMGDMPNPFPFEVFLSQYLQGGPLNATLAFATALPDEEPTVGTPFTLTFTVIGVQSGDIQVSITWDSDTDVDLYVEDPTGEVIYFGNRAAASGGALDLDANAACGGPGQINENIFWPVGAAPSGEYKIWVDYWSSCAFSGETHVRVTRILRRTDVWVPEEDIVFTPPDVGEDPYDEGNPFNTFTF